MKRLSAFFVMLLAMGFLPEVLLAWEHSPKSDFDTMLAFGFASLVAATLVVATIAVVLPKEWLLRPLIRAFSAVLGVAYALYGLAAALAMPALGFPGHLMLLTLAYLAASIILLRIAWKWRKPKKNNGVGPLRQPALVQHPVPAPRVERRQVERRRTGRRSPTSALV